MTADEVGRSEQMHACAHTHKNTLRKVFMGDTVIVSVSTRGGILLENVTILYYCCVLEEAYNNLSSVTVQTIPSELQISLLDLHD